jgi:hypothetical protein
MTAQQRAENRKQEVQQSAKLAAKVERFKKSAASVSTDRSDEKNVFTSYADREIKGLSLRDYEQAYATVYSGYDERELHLRWFLSRPGHQPLDLGDDIDAPDEARRYARSLLDGREDAIVNEYIDNSPDIDKYDCWCFQTSELLVDKTLNELEAEVESRRRYLAHVEKDAAAARRYACFLMPKRCRLRHMEAMLRRYAKFRERESLKIRINAKPLAPRKAA